MNRYIITIMALLLWGCQKKQMQLPQVEDTKITSVEDYSQVYLPYDPETGQGKLNANGLISSTNWIFHIDKRNKLSEPSTLVGYKRSEQILATLIATPMLIFIFLWRIYPISA